MSLWSILSKSTGNICKKPLREDVKIFGEQCSQHANDTPILLLIFMWDQGHSEVVSGSCEGLDATNKLRFNPDKMEVLLVSRLVYSGMGYNLP